MLTLGIGSPAIFQDSLSSIRPGIVAGGHSIAAQHILAVLQQPIKLDVLVAQDVWVGGDACLVLPQQFTAITGISREVHLILYGIYMCTGSLI